MMNEKRIISCILAVLVLISLAACSTVVKGDPADTVESEKTNDKQVFMPLAKERGSSNDPAICYQFDKSKTYAAAQIKDITGAEVNIGSLAEGFPKDGLCCLKLKCEVMCIFNYARLREAADAEDALYQYFDIGQFAWVGGGSVAKRLEKRPDDVFKGDITEEYLDSLKESNTSFTYSFYLDWDYKDSVEIGEIILVSIDPQVTINPNSIGTTYRIEDPKTYRAVVAPFNADHPQPHIAKFVDGKLQLPEELEDAFALRRLYDDTDPELTGIKDGDAIEDVVAFLKAVEQDMIRYEEEMRQQPAVTDVSSIR